ncbi:MAG: hypothetical protein GC160_26320 [Acidobacteria bacterium]|nr:hypothetical protein [Acidobacteriota bacterium]
MNYWNYFTEVEEHFQQARGTGLFLLSPLDWALLETWKDAGVPLEAVLKGVERAFEKYHKRKRRFGQVNSLAYCAQEVLDAARDLESGSAGADRRGEDQGFEPAALAEFFRSSAEQVRMSRAPAEMREGTAASLDQLAVAAEDGSLDPLEAVEQRLSVIEERLLASCRQSLSEDEMLEVRQEMDAQLAPYRSKMRAEQIALLQQQYLQRALFEKAALPRLSLFYLR